MKLKLILFFCLSAVANAHFAEPILGAVQARKYSFPNVVTVYSVPKDGEENQNVVPLFCSGTIYNEDWISLTGLCASKIGPRYPLADIRVAAGKWNISEPEPNEQIRSVVFVRVHDRFDAIQIGKSIDLGLLKLNESLRFNEFVKAFPFSSNLDYPFGFGIVVGWGASTERQIENNQRSNALHVLGVDISNIDSCRFAVRKVMQLRGIFFARNSFNRYHFCTGIFTHLPHGPIMDDTGSPFMKPIRRSFEVVGLISAGFIKPNLGLHLHISPYVEWIKQTVELNAHL